jgi:hypothetical protein
VIVKVDILNQNTLQVTLVKCQQLVNTFIAHRANPTLRECIRLGSLWRGEHDFHLFGHKQGVDALVRTVLSCADRGIEYLTVMVGAYGLGGALLAYLAIYSSYFANVAMAVMRGEADGAHFVGLLSKSVMLFVLVTVVLTIIAAIVAPKDARAPQDERERLIAAQRDGRVAQQLHVVLGGRAAAIRRNHSAVGASAIRVSRI